MRRMHGEYNKYIECMYRSLLTLRKYVGTLLEPARAGGLEEPEQMMLRPTSRPGPVQAGSRAAAAAHTLCSALPAPQAPMRDCGPIGGPGDFTDFAYISCAHGYLLYLSFLDLPRTGPGPDRPNPSRVLPVSTLIQSRELSYKWVLFMRVFIPGTHTEKLRNISKGIKIWI